MDTTRLEECSTPFSTMDAVAKERRYNSGTESPLLNLPQEIVDVILNYVRDDPVNTAALALTCARFFRFLAVSTCEALIALDCRICNNDRLIFVGDYDPRAPEGVATYEELETQEAINWGFEAKKEDEKKGRSFFSPHCGTLVRNAERSLWPRDEQHLAMLVEAITIAEMQAVYVYQKLTAGLREGGMAVLPDFLRAQVSK